ncbi:MAG: glycosyltransferase family 4 protein [Microcoleaceae cyanobacterium]
MVHFKVDFQNFNSFADITLSLATALSQFNIPVSLEPCQPSEDLLNLLTPEEIQQIKGWMNQFHSELFQVKWSHYWPTVRNIQLQGYWNFELFAINYQLTQLQPPFDDWIQSLCDSSSHKLAVSQYCKNILLQAGCDQSQVSVLPLGCNPILYNYPDPKRFLLRNQRPKIRILHLTNSWDLYRFGTDLLIPIFCKEFHHHPQIELLIKDGGSNQNAVNQLVETTQYNLGIQVSNIHIVRRLLNREDLGKLYLLADAVIAPFRGEGFAIKLLDAFAAGLPVAMPLYGGPTEYGNSENCYPIEYDLVPVKYCYDTQFFKPKNNPHWAEPKIDSIREQLYQIVTDPQRFHIGQKARKTAELFSWQATAAKLSTIIRELSLA